MNVLSVSITNRGREAAGLLPYEHQHGDLGPTLRERWHDVDAFVLFAATGIAVRVVGPLLSSKDDDPAVVCVDESGRHVIALCGGHAGGANALAREVGQLLGAEPIVSTASDARGMVSLDDLPGFRASGDLAGVTRSWLDGRSPRVENRLSWPVPLADGPGPAVVVVTDELLPRESGVASLHPPSLVVGVGASSDAPATAASELLDDALRDNGLARESIAFVATIDRRAGDPVVTSLGWPVRPFSASVLAGVAVPNPSERVAIEVGTASVAEAAALHASGPGASLVVPKRVGATATLAIARRTGPEGRVQVVGLGPGSAVHRTPAASAAVRSAEVVIGYERYVEQCRDLLSPAQAVIRSPIGAEAERCREALTRAAAGATVALVCSGDAGVFAMATVVLELAPGFGSPPVEVVPGVTAATAAAALLGAPLAHDYACISLSDLLTPWAVIEKRLRAAAESDMAVALYNPRSQRRTWQLARARRLLLDHRPPSTPAGICTNVGRDGQEVVRTTLGELDPSAVGMLSIVIVGSSTTEVVNDRLVTRRGYEL